MPFCVIFLEVMNRRVAITVGLGLLTVGVGLAVLNRPRPPIVTIGPHRTEMKFVPFSEANPKPWFDFKLPVFGRVAFPSAKPLPGVNPADDPRFVAGYIVVQSPGATWQSRGILDRWEIAGQRFGRMPWEDQVSVLRVGYPRSVKEASEPAKINIGGEAVPVYRTFDPTKLPARYEDLVIQQGELKISVRYLYLDGGEPSVEIMINAPVETGTVRVETGSKHRSSSFSTSGWFPVRVTATAEVAPDGTLSVDGTISHGLNDKPVGAPSPLKIRMKPKPPAAIKSA